MKECEHLGAFDLHPKTGVRPALVLCGECMDLVARAMQLQVAIAKDAEDDSVKAKGAARLLFALTGERGERGTRARKYTAEQRERRRAYNTNYVRNRRVRAKADAVREKEPRA